MTLKERAVEVLILRPDYKNWTRSQPGVEVCPWDSIRALLTRGRHFFVSFSVRITAALKLSLRYLHLTSASFPSLTTILITPRLTSSVSPFLQTYAPGYIRVPQLYLRDLSHVDSLAPEWCYLFQPRSRRTSLKPWDWYGLDTDVTIIAHHSDSTIHPFSCYLDTCYWDHALLLRPSLVTELLLPISHPCPC